MYTELFLAFYALIIISLITLWVFSKVTMGICKCSKNLVGKVIIVTGGCRGIGFETAKDLAERGGRIIVADVCDNGWAAINEMISLTGNTNIHFRHLDLASLQSVRDFASDFLKNEKRLDILINNAGVFGSENVKTEDGLLLGMQINYFGPFLLTNMLLPILKSSAPSRIINVSSMAHYFGKIDLENLNLEKNNKKVVGKGKIYANSKLSLILMTLELSRRLQGSGVTANCLHPGTAATFMARSTDIFFIRYSLCFLKLFWKTTWQAAQTSIYLAVSPEVDGVNGNYFSDCTASRTFTRQANNTKLAQELWTTTEKLVGIGNTQKLNMQEKSDSSILRPV